uniref:T9SS type A sorting domain-containing protein n=1 Tax=Ignavibacterium album TaxID=591197 RepID=A0A7V2ZIV1_9BACT
MSGVEVVPLQGLTPDKITIRRNVIHNNDFGNIFIDTSANYGIRPPYNLQYNSGLITGKHAIPNAIIDIYSANRYELSASAYFRIGTTTTDANGNFSYSTNLNVEAISVTATDFLGNTSGFARINIITDVENEEQIPKEFSLSQNYPNPFNPTTKISWQSPVGSRQTLKIYDVIGNEVATLVDEYRDAGRYEVEFDASGLSSGVYFYKLTLGSFTETKKMLILK